MSRTGIFSTAPGYRLCLASASSRRQQLLASAGLDFFVFPTNCPEAEPETGERPETYALATAAQKATAASLSLADSPDFKTFPTAIIACDTIVCLDSHIFGKPASFSDLLNVLGLLNGRGHQVYTAVEILWPAGDKIRFVESTTVHFGSWPETVLEAYAIACKPYDKAGGYGIQDGGGFLVSKIEGSWSNVVGLPLSRILQTLLARGLIRPNSSP